MATQSTSLAKRSADTLKPPNKLDRSRWHLFNQRKSYEEIAELHGVKVLAVQQSIDRVQMYRDLTSASEIGLELNSVVLQHVGHVSAALSEALTAEHVVRKTNSEGVTEVVSTSPDHGTRLHAIDRVLKIADRNLPKGGGVHVAVQQNAGGGPAPTEKHISFEELMRQQRTAKGLTNGDAIEEAEYVDVDESEEEDEDGDGE
jgi:hypothetical protein